MSGIPPQRVSGNSLGRVYVLAKLIEEKVKLNWNFPGEGKKPIYPLWLQYAWKFSEITHLTTLIRLHFFGQSTIFYRYLLVAFQKNESLNEDMVDILQHLHSNYVPMSEVNGAKTSADFVCFGGDQLTEERSRNILKARADGRSVDEKLDVVWCRNEDWHGIRVAYQVCSFVVVVVVVVFFFFLGGGGGKAVFKLFLSSQS